MHPISPLSVIIANLEHRVLPVCHGAHLVGRESHIGTRGRAPKKMTFFRARSASVTGTMYLTISDECIRKKLSNLDMCPTGLSKLD